MSNKEFVNYARYVWNVVIEENDADLLLTKYPSILKDFNLQKSILGKNMFEGRIGHKSPKQIALQVKIPQNII